MARQERPLSPHLLIYRPQLTSVLSILHRFTGFGLCVGSLLLTWWLMAAADDAESFALVNAFMGSLIGRTVLLGFAFCLFYHLCNGIRHLLWDIGVGFEIRSIYRSGWIVVIASISLTLLSFLLGYAVRGGS